MDVDPALFYRTLGTMFKISVGEGLMNAWVQIFEIFVCLSFLLENAQSCSNSCLNCAELCLECIKLKKNEIWIELVEGIL